MKWRSSLNELRLLAGQYYPAFVYSASPSVMQKGQVPVFMFHTIRETEFSEQLGYLAENHYHTPSMDEFYSFLSGRHDLPPRSIMLTFDDVERSLLTVGLPLLKQYGFRCTAFLVPGRIDSAEKYNASKGQSNKAWPSWNDVRMLAASGLVDLGSHSLHHARIFTGDKVTGFAHPGCFIDGLGLDNPMVRNGQKEYFLDQPGAPLFRMSSRLGASRRFFDDETIRTACIQFAEDNGGDSFFQKSGWRRTLNSFWMNLSAELGKAGTWESEADARNAVRHELTASRERLEAETGRKVLDFAYPWTEGCPLSVELSKEAGYRTNFWGPGRKNPAGSSGQDPFYVSRIKEDYIFRLPGRSRKSLVEILRRKAARRLERADIY